MNWGLEPTDAPPEDEHPEDDEYEPDYEPDDFDDPGLADEAADRYERGFYDYG